MFFGSHKFNDCRRWLRLSTAQAVDVMLPILQGVNCKQFMLLTRALLFGALASLPAPLYSARPLEGLNNSKRKFLSVGQVLPLPFSTHERERWRRMPPTFGDSLVYFLILDLLEKPNVKAA